MRGLVSFTPSQMLYVQLALIFTAFISQTMHSVSATNTYMRKLADPSEDSSGDYVGEFVRFYRIEFWNN